MSLAVTRPDPAVPRALERPERRAGKTFPPNSWGDRLAVFILLLCPTPPFLVDIAVRLLDLVRFGAVGARLMFVPRPIWGTNVTIFTLLMLSMLGFEMVSLLRGESVTIRDFMDVMRLIPFLGIFLFGTSLAQRGKGQSGALIGTCHLLLTIAVANAIFTIMQYALPVATRPIQQFYSVERHMDVMDIQGRGFGFFVNPNVNALMTVLLSLSALPPYRLTGKWRYLLFGGLVLFSVIFTGSRTGLAMAGLVASVVCLSTGRAKFFFGFLLVAGGMYLSLDAIVQSGIVKEIFPYLGEFLVKIHGAVRGGGFDANEFNSFAARVEIWDDTLDWFYKYPVFGAGPLRDVIPSYADNYYVYQLSRFGVVGCAHYCVLMLFVASLSIRAILTRLSPYQEFGSAALAALVALCAANYTMDAFATVPIASVSLIYMGYLAMLMDIHGREVRARRLARSRFVQQSTPRAEDAQKTNGPQRRIDLAQLKRASGLPRQARPGRLPGPRPRRP
ncbi:O-antigen ligase family protein [Planctomicrobium sp. SH664]|uniref:O-antigen ligase family protein n=1 Tax=Planctomicrobium sp. SH664 TaxID=3448125 RepID=UPI003F5AFB4D